MIGRHEKAIWVIVLTGSVNGNSEGGSRHPPPHHHPFHRYSLITSFPRPQHRWHIINIMKVPTILTRLSFTVSIFGAPYKRWIHQCDLFNGPLINPSASVWWTPSFSDDRASIQIELLFLLFLYQQAFTKHRCFIELKDWTGFFGTYKVWGSDISPFIQMVIKDSECLATTQLCLLSNPKLLTCHHFTDWGCFQRPVRVLGSNESLVGGSTSYTKEAQGNQTPSTMILHLHWSF